MRLRAFQYAAAENLEHALEFLRAHGTETKLLAGGTDLVLAMKEKKVRPARVLSLHTLKELAAVIEEDGLLRIGALCRLADLEDHAGLRKRLPALSQAAASIGSWQIRNTATLGGNLCTASPAADSAPALLALEARVVLAGADKEETRPLDEFFLGPGDTILQPHQLLKEIRIPLPAGPSAGSYLKLTRKRAVDLALVGVACCARLDANGRLNPVRIAMGGVAPTPVRAQGAEAILAGLDPATALKALEDAAQAAAREARPITDLRASARYRRDMVSVLVRRAAAQVLGALLHKEAKA